MEKSLHKLDLYKRDWIIAILVSAIACSFWWFFIPRMSHIGSDGIEYLKIASGKIYDVPSPFRYRILIPFILLWFKNKLFLFGIISFISEIIAGLFLFMYLRKFFTTLWSLIGTIIFFFSFNGPYYAWYPYLTDPLNLALISLSFYLIINDKISWQLLLILSLGVLNRETLILIVIPLFIYLVLKNDTKTAIKISIPFLMLPALIILSERIIIDSLFPSQTGYGGTILSYFKNVFFSSAWLQKIGGLNAVITSIIGTYGIWWIFAFYGFSTAEKRLKYFLIFLLPFIGMGLADTERMLMQTFPVVIPFSVYGIQSLYKKLPQKSKIFLFTIIFLSLLFIQTMWSISTYTSTDMLKRVCSFGLSGVFSLFVSQIPLGLILPTIVVIALFIAIYLKRWATHLVSFLFLFSIIFFNAVPVAYNPKYHHSDDPGCYMLSKIEQISLLKHKNPFEILGFNWAFQKYGKWITAEKLLDKGDTLSARKLFSEALKDFPTLKERYNFFVTYFACLNNYDEALKWGKYGLFFTPDNSNIPYNLGLIHFRKGNIDSAKVYLERAVKIDSTNESALINLAIIFMNNFNNCDSALSYAAKAVNIASDNPEIRMNYLAILQQCGDTKKLLDEIDNFLSDFPDHPSKNTLIKLKEQLKLKQGVNL